MSGRAPRPALGGWCPGVALAGCSRHYCGRICRGVEVSSWAGWPVSAVGPSPVEVAALAPVPGQISPNSPTAQARGCRRVRGCGSLNGCRAPRVEVSSWARCPALRWQPLPGVGFPFSPRGCFSAGGVPTITPPPAFYTHGQNLWPFGGADRPVIAACRGVSCPGWPALLCRTLALSRLALGGVGRAPRQLAAAVLVSGWAPFIGLRPSRVGYPAALV